MNGIARVPRIPVDYAAQCSGAPTTTWANICAFNIRIPHIHVGYAGAIAEFMYNSAP